MRDGNECVRGGKIPATEAEPIVQRAFVFVVEKVDLSWDLECLIDVIDIALDDPRDYPDRSSEEYKALKGLHNRLKDEYQINFDWSKSEQVAWEP